MAGCKSADPAPEAQTSQVPQGDAPVETQDWAKARLADSPRHAEWVDIQAGDRTVKTYVVYPEVSKKVGTVVIIHEIMGMTDWIQVVADELAKQGYIALAPDLLSGMGADGGRSDSFEPGKAREAVSSLPADQVTSDLNAVCDYALKVPAGNGTVSVVGYCWGGTQSFRFATNRADLKAAFVYYGTAPTDPAELAKIKTPVYGFYGENDARITATLEKTKAQMAEAGKTYEAVIYEGAGHGFLRTGMQPDAEEANKKAAEKAWTRWLELLKKHQGG